MAVSVTWIFYCISVFLFFFFFAPKNFSFNVFQSRKTESKDSKRGVKDVDPHKSFGANKDKCEIQHQSEGQDKMQVECMLFTACLLSCNRCSGSLLVGERVPI